MKDYEEEDFNPTKLSDNELSKEEKIYISDRIKKLNSDGLHKVINLIKSENPSILIEEKEYKDRLRISVENMDKIIFLKLDEIINEFIVSNKGKVKAKNNYSSNRDKTKKNKDKDREKQDDSETNSICNYSNSYKNIES